MIQVIPFEEGYDGETWIDYGPIGITPTVNDAVRRFVSEAKFEMVAGGAIIGDSATRVSVVKGEYMDLLFYSDSNAEKKVLGMRIDVDMKLEPLYTDFITLVIYQREKGRWILHSRCFEVSE